MAGLYRFGAKRLAEVVVGPISVTDHLGWVVCVEVGLDLGVCWRVLCREELLGGMLGSWNFF